MKLKLIFFLLLFIVPITFAQENVKIGVYVLNVGKFEVSTGSYTVDFYLSMECDTNCSPGNFEFLNGRATSIDKIIDDPDSKFYRIQASLSQNINLESYPFDTHSLSIEIEDKTKTIDEIMYSLDENNSGIDPAVIIVGWNLKDWSAEVREHYYEPYDETYSRYIFNINIERVKTSAFFKVFLPVFFIVIVSLSALFIGADKIGNRIGINTSALVGAVLFHINATSSIPPVGYLTLADKFMIATYIILILSLVSTVLLMRHSDAKDVEKASHIYKKSMKIIPLLTLVLYILVFII